MSNSEKSDKIPNLDGLRCIAIVLVIIGHLRYNQVAISTTSNFLSIVASFGSMGVDIFFAISGFLITNRLLLEQSRYHSISLKKFYLRRFFRLMPALLVYIVFVASFSKITHLVEISDGELWASIFFYRNYFGGAGGWFTAHFWSLAVEEHYYILFPAFLIAVKRYRISILKSVFALAVFLIVWQLTDQFIVETNRFWTIDLHLRSDYRILGLIAGSLAGARWTLRTASTSEPKIQTQTALLGALCVIFVLLLKFKSPFENIWRPFFLAEIVMQVVQLKDHVLVGILKTKLFVWIGHISYSLYLWQQFCLVPLDLRNNMIWTEVPSNLCLLIALASLSYYIVEKPLIKFGHKMTHSF